MTAVAVADGAGGARTRKFRHAAFVYLHLGILYEAAAWVMWRHDMLPSHYGPPVLYLVAGVVIVAGVFVLLWRESVWAARIMWGIQAFRFPALISRAFVEQDQAAFPPAFYVAAMVVVLTSMAFLARAGWDL